jgi:hypothetical protein
MRLLVEIGFDDGDRRVAQGQFGHGIPAIEI